MRHVTIQDEHTVLERHRWKDPDTGKWDGGTTVLCPSCGVYSVFLSWEETRRIRNGGWVRVECDGCEAYRDHTNPYQL